MKKLIIPDRLKIGDTVATVSLSWGGAGDEKLLYRYETGKKRLEEMGLNVVEMDSTLKGSEYVYNHPEKRAKDLMNAFKDPEIKAIISCIGGDDSIRLLPYIDYEVIRNNPKIFIGYSDTTITHLIMYKAGVRSYYGPSILGEFGENIEIFPYTLEYISQIFFEGDSLGFIKPAEFWSGERIEWLYENRNFTKLMQKNTGYEVLQGEGIVEGHLLGGCVDVLEMAKGTEIWPDINEFDGAILFLETSEETMSPDNLLYSLRNYGAQKILQRLNGILFGKPYQNKYYEEYKDVIRKVLKEYKLETLPVMYNLSFGHNQPMHIIPYGAVARLDLNNKRFSIY